jgi:hypothetical protein
VLGRIQQEVTMSEGKCNSAMDPAFGADKNKKNYPKPPVVKR